MPEIRQIPALTAAFLSGVLSLSADDTERLADLFEAASKGGVITIPPGDYRLSGDTAIALSSNTTIIAYGARFHFPESLGSGARPVLFAGTDVKNLTWQGGEFLGRVFDPSQQENTWEPNVNSKGIEITTTVAGGTGDLFFREVRSNGVGGAVIGVHGRAGRSSESAVEAYAERVVLESCTLLRSGKFMWDYGYLWQILTWPEDFEPWEVERARRYFRSDLLRQAVMKKGDERIAIDPALKSLPISKTDDSKEALSFFGSSLPSPLKRGLQYFVVESGEGYLKVSELPGGKPITFEEDSGEDSALAHHLSATYLSAYAPTGSSPGKGAFDIVGARDVRVTGCMLSALGDTMHIQRSENVVFANNHILGSRMGAFFLAEYCRNATITGNLVDGTNGSRVVSVEKSCTDVVMTGNTFRNGGRGAWINQPVNFVLANNIFVNNTTKNEADPRRGRIAYRTAGPGRFPELYFTLHEEGGTYGPVIVRDNVFQFGDAAPVEAVTFAPNGRDLQMSGNTFPGRATSIAVDPSCEGVAIRDNPGAELKRTSVDFNHGRR